MRVVLTTATLDKETGDATCKSMQKTAGIECSCVVGWDEKGDGGTKTANKAMKRALEQDPDYICYFNDDVSPRHDGWLKRMIEALESNELYGVAGTSGHCGTMPQMKGTPGLPKKISEVKLLSFFLVVIKRAVIEDIGLLDESYTHFGCDGDYCLRAQDAGWKVIWVQDVYIEHEKAPMKTRPPKVRRWKIQDATRFKKQWGHRL